jgi:uncharacterized protein YgbK (DUF1537 family)
VALVRGAGAVPGAGQFTLVLDDDLTGTQCAAGVDVLLRPGDTGIPELLRGPAAAGYALTNTRSLPAGEAAAVVRRIRELTIGGADRGRTARLVLRGDSTLRGHVFAEMAELGLARAAGLIVPAYPAAGRITIGGVHYLGGGKAPVNVAETEFARDPVFGFTARTLPEWVREVGGERPVRTIGLERPAAERAAEIRDALLALPDGGVLLPDVRTDGDLAPIAAGLRAAWSAGRDVVLRCAAPLAALIAGVPGRPVPRPSRRAERLLLVCGSHTAAATAQLDALTGLAPPRLVLPTGAAGSGGWERAAGALAGAARDLLDRYGVAVLCTERVRRPEHGSLAAGAAVMTGLISVVRRLAPEVDAIVAKGGITSAEVATTALGGGTARVDGQIEVGISLWQVATCWGTRMPAAIVPGNIGDAGTLARMLAFFRPQQAGQPPAGPSR